MYNRKQNKYVGARYVPKFDERGDWDISNEYESLIIVTHQGASYTSKKFVPSGIDITNTDYWVCTGNYNQQVEAYRQEVNNFTTNIQSVDDKVSALDNEIKHIYDKKYILLGDSYGCRLANNWITYFINTLGLTQGVDVFSNAKGGTAFYRLSDTHKTFLELLQEIEGDIADKTQIGDIVILGGFNDADNLKRGVTNSLIQNAIKEFSTYCKNNFPNATIHLGQVGVTPMNEFQARLYQVTNIYRQCGMYPNMVYILNSESILHNSYWLDTDLYHPNSTGGNILGQQAIIGVKQGCVNNTYAQIPTIEPVTGTNISNHDIITMLYNNTLSFVSKATMTITFDTPFNLKSDTYYKLFTMKNTCVFGNSEYASVVPLTYCAVTCDEGEINVMGHFVINECDVYLVLEDRSGGSVHQWTNISKLVITPCRQTFETFLY